MGGRGTTLLVALVAGLTVAVASYAVGFLPPIPVPNESMSNPPAELRPRIAYLTGVYMRQAAGRDAAVATINGDVVTEEDLLRAAAAPRAIAEAQPQTPPSLKDAFYKKLVPEILLRQEAVRRGYSVEPSEVDTAVEHQREEENGITDSEGVPLYHYFLEGYGMTADEYWRMLEVDFAGYMLANKVRREIDLEVREEGGTSVEVERRINTLLETLRNEAEVNLLRPDMLN